MSRSLLLKKSLVNSSRYLGQVANADEIRYSPPKIRESTAQTPNFPVSKLADLLDNDNLENRQKMREYRVVL